MAVQSLREAQKALARERLLEAAKTLFYSDGYPSVTLEQIAAAAGTRRTTLYTHFKDKEDMLRCLAEDYATKICSVLGTLKGPSPSRAEIDTWLADMAKFAVAERTAAVIFGSFGMQGFVGGPVEALGEAMYESLATEVPAFRVTHSKSLDRTRAREWARAILRQLTVAFAKQGHPSGQDLRSEFKASLEIAGDMLELFITRYAEPE